MKTKTIEKKEEKIKRVPPTKWKDIPEDNNCGEG
jgi:hypothetical protein